MGEEQKKSGFVTIVGRPNAGKSTLMNAIIGQKIAITSKKPETTRKKILAVYTDDRGQIVFTDTPGIHKARTRLGEFMMEEVRRAAGDVDLLLWITEPVQTLTAEDRRIAEYLKGEGIPVILVINKSDTISHDAMLPVIAAWKDALSFSDIVPVSAWKGTGVPELVSTIFSRLPYGPLYYDEDTVTDETERDIASEIIREKALYALSEEVPHGIAVTIDRMHTRPDRPLVDIDAVIWCEKDSHKGIIIGKQGRMLKKIGSDARYELEKMTGKQVNLKLWVKVSRGWRNEGRGLKKFGYVERDE